MITKATKEVTATATAITEGTEVAKKGRGLLWKGIGERVEFIARDGLKYEFISYFDKTGMVQVCEHDRNDRNAFNICGKPFQYFSIEDLQVMGVWDILRDDQKKIVETSLIQANQNILRDDNEKKHNRQPRGDYTGIPRELTCSKCKETKPIAPAQVVKRALAQNISVEEFAKAFICLKCNPKQRGRKANPKYADYPREMKCTHEGCKVVYPQQPSMTEKLAEGKGITWKEYVKTWKCKEHRIKKVHHFTQERLDREARGEIKAPKTAKKRGENGEVKRRGRAANPEFEGMPKGLTCCVKGCGFFQIQHPSISIKQAEKKGITLDEYFASWKCKAHREKKVHHMSKEARKDREIRKGKK